MFRDVQRLNFKNATSDQIKREIENFRYNYERGRALGGYPPMSSRDYGRSAEYVLLIVENEVQKLVPTTHAPLSTSISGVTSTKPTEAKIASNKKLLL